MLGLLKCRQMGKRCEIFRDRKIARGRYRRYSIILTEEISYIFRLAFFDLRYVRTQFPTEISPRANSEHERSVTERQ